MTYQLDTNIYDKNIITNYLNKKNIKFQEKEWNLIIKKKEDFLLIIDQYIYI